VSRTITFPDGTTITGGRIADAVRDASPTPPDLGLYAHGGARPTATRLGHLINRITGRPLHAGSWSPVWEVVWIRWPDMGVPVDDGAAVSAIEAAFARAKAGERVEVRCLGGKGRTGTILCCMALLAGVPAADAVGWVRDRYDRRAVERRSQHDWVARFASGQAARQVR
jgi:hypothetical protein